MVTAGSPAATLYGKNGMLLRLFLFLSLIWFGFRFFGKLISAILKEFQLNEPDERIRMKPASDEKTADMGIDKEHAEDADYEDIV